MINEYKTNQSIENVTALVLSKQLAKTKNGSSYFKFTLSDKTGEINGNLWDISEESQKLSEGEVALLNAAVVEYNGKKQLNIKSIRQASLEEGSDPANFIESAPLDTKDMEGRFESYLNQIISSTLHSIVKTIFNKYEDEYFNFPAAKSNHHAFNGGLAFHSLTMAKLVDSISNIYPSLNKELLLSGALLHDMGKLIELSGPVATKYTVSGNLLGHITLIDEQIVLAANQLNIDIENEEVVLLRHLILSHHGKMEWGSPVEPQITEAMVLHSIDELDANMQIYSKAVSQIQPGDFSGKIFALGHSIYRPNNEAETK